MTMKKVIITILAAGAVLASCTKSDVQYDEPSAINLAPFAKKSTKAAVDGTDYPDALNMYVFANAGAADAAVPGGYTEPYFANAEFAHGSHAVNVFGGYPSPYYWPNVKKLIFSGYSKSGNVASLTTKPTYSWSSTENTWEISISGYQPGAGTATSGDNDLMWFPTTEQSYAKPTESDYTVDVTMKHACAWVTINIQGDNITGGENTTWKILDLTFSDLVQTGNVVLGKEANWTIGAGTAFDAYTGNGTALTTNYVDYTKLSYQDLVVIPQPTKTLHVKYSYVSQKGGGADGADIVIEEEKDIPLTYTNDAGWKAGVHYTYNLTIGTTEILIEPVLTDWTDQPVPAITVQ